MNYIKRAFLYIVNTKKDAIQIILIFTILSSLIMIAFSIRSAARISCKDIRRQLGSTVTLRYNTSFDTRNVSHITPEMADKLNGLKNTHDINRITMSFANAADFEPFSGGIKLPTLDNSSNPQRDVYTYGATNTEKLTEFKNGSSKLLRGRHIVVSDSGHPVVMIEKALAEKNNLQPGDTITLKAVDRKVGEYQLTIVGIYESTSKGTLAFASPALQKENKLYLTPESVYKLSGEERLDQIIVTLDDPLYTDEFIKEAKHAIRIPSNCILDANDAVYHRLAGPLDNLMLLCSIIAIVVAIAGIAILTLIVMLSIKERKYEIGILLSLGEVKAKILAQLVIEMLFPVIIAISLAIGISYSVSQNIGDKVLQSQINRSENRNANEEASDEIAIEKINVQPAPGDIAALYMSGILITFISAVVPSLLIVRYNPKEILLRIE